MTTGPSPHRIPPLCDGEHVDALVVGARCAGAATARLLASRGLSVVAVDRSAYGSDTLSSHALMRGAVRRLHEWGVLDRVWAAGTPVVTRTLFRYGETSVAFDALGDDVVPGLAAPRRTLLDRLLVDAAVDRGARVHHGTRVEALVTDASGRVTGARLTTDDGRLVTVRSSIVIGADGLHSSVARAVGAPVTHVGSHASAYVLRYVRGAELPHDTFTWSYRPGLGAGAVPSDGGVWCVFVAVPPNRLRSEGRTDPAALFDRLLPAVDTALARGVAAGTAVGPVRTWPGVPGRFRRPHGPGWALVGDAGYVKDPFAAHGISDAFRDAELLAGAVETGDLDAYERERDRRSRPLFDVLERIASYEWDLGTLPSLHVRLARSMRDEEAAAGRA